MTDETSGTHPGPFTPTDTSSGGPRDVRGTCHVRVETDVTGRDMTTVDLGVEIGLDILWREPFGMSVVIHLYTKPLRFKEGPLEVELGSN